VLAAQAELPGRTVIRAEDARKDHSSSECCRNWSRAFIVASEPGSTQSGKSHQRMIGTLWCASDVALHFPESGSEKVELLASDVRTQSEAARQDSTTVRGLGRGGPVRIES
jgi:hypothetical protein